MIVGTRVMNTWELVGLRGPSCFCARKGCSNQLHEVAGACKGHKP